MTHSLHIVAACTDRKRGHTLPEHRLGHYDLGPNRAQRWMDALGRETPHARPLRELYVGDHWSHVRGLGDVAHQARWSEVRQWVASAGVGLASLDESWPPYAATFSSRHEDSVSAPVSAAGADARWWSDCNRLARGTRSVRSLRGLLEKEPAASLLIVASRAYVDAIGNDLVEGIAHSSHPSRIVIITSALPRAPQLHAHAVRATAALRTTLGGTLTALHARLAFRVLETVDPEAWSVERVSELVSSLTSSASPQVTPIRAPLSDPEVEAFIRAELKREPNASATGLLRVLRASGRACEQKRFRQRFLAVEGPNGRA